MRHHAFAGDLSRGQLIDWYQTTRARTRSLFDLIQPEAYYDRPIALRNPIVFYEGHLPAFSVNTLVKLALKRKGIDEQLEVLFARGIDPEDEAGVKNAAELWPSRDVVQAYAREADALIVDTLANATLEDEAVPELRGGEAVLTLIEHELMHQETLLYILHELPHAKKRPSVIPRREDAEGPRAASGRRSFAAAQDDRVTIPAGRASLGNNRGTFGWDNEFPPLTVDVPEFAIDALNVTNGDYLEYMQATGASAPHFWSKGEREWYWRGMFAMTPLPLDAPVYVTHDEAAAFARWKGARLPAEAEWHRASGDGPPQGNFDFAHWDPVAVGSYEPNEHGIHDLTGNGWEWTSSVFDGFPGFRPMPSYLVYSADFFDGVHYVLKGASQATARELIRPSFRNWFRPNYPYVYAAFRCAR